MSKFPEDLHQNTESFSSPISEPESDLADQDFLYTKGIKVGKENCCKTSHICTDICNEGCNICLVICFISVK